MRGEDWGLEEIEEELERISARLPSRLDADPENVDASLARLVLTLVEFVRRVLEHQAVQRMEAGNLSDEEIERLGLALLRLQERMDELRDFFGLSAEDLNVDLGPLGRLV